MEILLLVATRDDSLRQFVGAQKNKTFPQEAFKRGFLAQRKVRQVVNAVDVREFTTSDDLEAFVEQRLGSADGLLLLIDQESAGLAKCIRSAALVCEIDVTRASRNYQNFLHDRLSKLAKTINYLARHFNDGSDAPLLSLPLRNFKCPALAGLQETIAADPCNSQIADSVDASLQRLRRRVRPRKKTSYKTKYAVDDKERFFVFGKEKHALPDSGAPHRRSCKLNSCFRFGCRIDDTRHFNVSEGEGDTTTISGEFTDCHGDKRSVAGGTHINMFSNDFF
ncbi:hypothetical protein DD556_12440 [Phaeobacter sp. JL2872]|uniref:hypothetical protein n=1 Tax=Phaeobacter sp. JL2872 TaxID=2461377 RepID=UPI0008034D60|nr:hypothetical protein [Phaeobacter sp. JL2872]PVZ46394.1 hypothetical protein DD556_12440 [Phaeobacter sp. JL2872]